ncbi:polyprenyl synthetase family protein [Streptacidiphilus sp. MAP12-16]|uniref:polyprenyl synthetase family protein n=1 Tax=Streptacidiphilus sp. MAP12-16 TaxID=3156300 RepID=UPI003516A809
MTESPADWVRDLVDPALRTETARLHASVRQVVGYHFAWWDEHGRPTTEQGGKRIRPALAFLSAKAIGAQAKDALPAAVAVELVHNFSLLHDDVMDGDTLRRHRPTAWSVFGAPRAILAGDALLGLAWQVLAESGSVMSAAAMSVMGEDLLALTNGQGIDLEFERRTEVDLAECLAMAAGKTSSLLGCSCALGALFAGADSAQVGRLRQFGHHLGMSFQLVDDLLGLWGRPATTGKPVLADLRARKKSLPVVAALTSGTRAGAELAELYLRPDPLTGGELRRAALLVELAGGKAWCETAVGNEVRLALECLDAAGLPPGGRTDLAAIAEKLAHRNR